MPHPDLWADVKAFVAQWAEPIAPGDGYPPELLDITEARLGRKLPAAMREMYELLALREDLTEQQNRVISPEELEIENGYLVFWSENQCVCHWAVAESDLALDNPPVFMLTDSTGGIWKPEPGAEPVGLFTEAALLLIATEMMLAGEFCAISEAAETDTPEMLDLRKRSQPTPYSVLNKNGYALLHDALVWFWEGQLVIKTRDEESLIALIDSWDTIEWDYVSVDDA